MVKVISAEYAMAEPAPVISRGRLFRNPLVFRKKTEEAVSEIPSERFDRISAALTAEIMRKPVYADCWTVGSRESLRVIESYTMPLGDVTIGIAEDGEMEYNLIPKDYGYGRELTEAIGSTIDAVRDRYRKKGGNMDRQSVYASAREELCRVHQDSDGISWTMDYLCKSVYR